MRSSVIKITLSTKQTWDENWSNNSDAPAGNEFYETLENYNVRVLMSRKKSYENQWVNFNLTYDDIYLYD